MRIVSTCLWILCACIPSPKASRGAVQKPAIPPPVATVELAPAPAATAEPPAPTGLRVAVISDLNSTYGSKRYTSSVHAATEALVERVQPDLVLITGDMVAGQKSGLDYRGMWQAFHASVTDPLLEAGIPVAPTPGNHDAAPGFAKERRQYVAQWRDPKRAARVQYLDDSSYPLHYSFEQGGVFFAAVDATAVGPLRGRQHEWLDAQLAQTQADVKIVFGHLPIHPFAQHREREILADTELELILRRHDVAAYISGHHHAYYPGAVNGIRHVAAPCLGAGARALIGRSRRSPPALLVLDIDASGIAALEALQAPGFADVIERKTLPPRIDHRGHAVVRDDLAAN